MKESCKMNLEYITNELKEKMKMNVPDLQQYETWIGILKPLNKYDNTIYLEIPKNDTKFIFDQIWVPQLQSILNDINKRENTAYKIEIVAKDGPNYDEVLSLGKNVDDDGQLRLNNVNKYPKPLLEKNNVFKNFVQGKSNQLALAASQSVAENMANYKVSRVYNPLFIYGASGLGKTHLMQAIAHEILEKRDDCYVMYLSSEKFTNEMISAVRNNTNEEFRKKYRSVDMLLIDDIQFIANKTGTQEEFFHTFEDLYNQGKQIVISSDRPPKEIKHLEDRLVSRFGWGIIVDISKPDFETRVAILQKKQDELGAVVDYKILEYIAENIETNIRDLEGALATSIACAKSNNRSFVSLEDARLGVSSRVHNDRKKINAEDIQKKVAERYHVKLADLRGKSRKKEIVMPRQIAMYLCRDLLSISLVSLANEFNRDHTTVMHGHDKIKDLMEEDQDFRQEIEEIIKEIKA